MPLVPHKSVSVGPDGDAAVATATMVVAEFAGSPQRMPPRPLDLSSHAASAFDSTCKSNKTPRVRRKVFICRNQLPAGAAPTTTVNELLASLPNSFFNVSKTNDISDVSLPGASPKMLTASPLKGPLRFCKVLTTTLTEAMASTSSSEVGITETSTTGETPTEPHSFSSPDFKDKTGSPKPSEAAAEELPSFPTKRITTSRQNSDLPPPPAPASPTKRKIAAVTTVKESSLPRSSPRKKSATAETMPGSDVGMSASPAKTSPAKKTLGSPGSGAGATVSKGGKTKKDDSEVFKKPLLPPPMKMMKNEMLPETKEGKDTTQYLRNWIPKLRGRKLRLEGDLWDAKQNEYHQARWKSSTIKRRKTNTLLEVGKSLKIYVLEGKLSVDHAMTENIPEFIIQTFMDGFPEHWKDLRDRWHALGLDSTANSTALSTTSSVGDASAFESTPSLPKVAKAKRSDGGKEASKKTTQNNLSIGPSRRAANEVQKKTSQKKPVLGARGRKNLNDGKDADAPRSASTRSTKQSSKKTSAPRDPKRDAQLAELADKFFDPDAKLYECQFCFRTITHVSRLKQHLDMHERHTGAVTKFFAASLGGKSCPETDGNVTVRDGGQVGDAGGEHVVKRAVVVLKRLSPRLLNNKLSRSTVATKKSPPSVPPGRKSAVRKKTTASLEAHQLVSNPKTVGQRKANAKILQNMNEGHEDDLFEPQRRKPHSARGRKSAPAKNSSSSKMGPENILADLFASDSENDLSVHSARTPIAAYYEPKKKWDNSLNSSTKSPATKKAVKATSEETPRKSSAAMLLLQDGKRNSFKDHAFIHRKIKENQKIHKLHSTKPDGPLLLSGQEDMPRRRTKKTSVLTEPIAKLMRDVNQAEDADGEDEDFPEPYFSDYEDDDDGEERNVWQKATKSSTKRRR